MKITRSLFALLLAGAVQPAALAQTPDAVRMQAFAQGQANNCISVALIKAAIQRYGLYQVFDTLRTGDLTQITLRDRTVLTLSDAERRQAAQWARFKQPPNPALPAAEQAALVRYAQLCYAVLAKYIATQKLYLCTDERTNQADSARALGSYQKALKKLTNTSICSDNAYRHLGLRATDATARAPRYQPAAPVSARGGVVAYSDKHAVFVLGQQYDDHGHWAPLAAQVKADDVVFEPKWYFELR